ncbi:F-box family protein [Artemisia annua]|uniref:F-box family protein n=1 Tax=Artemisia annua TaxID=35608 RepID=A0A2U1PRK3_ARTAN|nr:F-box family protein [Artemisia annua]
MEVVVPLKKAVYILKYGMRGKPKLYPLKLITALVVMLMRVYHLIKAEVMRFAGEQGAERGSMLVVKVNVEKALDLFLKGAERGSMLAMVDAGLVYWEIRKKEGGVTMEADTF